MATPYPSVGDTVTPGEYGNAYLRYLQGVQSPTDPALLQQQLSAGIPEAAAAPEATELASQLGLLGRTGQYVKSYGQIPGNFAKFINPGNEFGAADLAESLPGGAGSIAGYVAAAPLGHLAGQLTGNQQFGGLTKNVIKDAAIGAGIGSFVPIPGVGTGLGAAAGGAIGALTSLFHKGGSDADTVKNLQGQRDAAFQSLSGMGISPSTLAAIRTEYDSMLNNSSPVSGQDAKGNPITLSGVDAGRARAFSYLSQVQQYQGAQPGAALPGLPDQSASSTGLSAQSMLALQSETTKLMQPMYQQLQHQGDAEVNAWAAQATPAGQKVSAATQNLANVYKGNIGELEQAYQLQAQAQPFLNAVAANTYNQGLQAQASPSSSGSSLAQLLASSPSATGQASAQAGATGVPSTATNYGGNNPVLIQ